MFEARLEAYRVDHRFPRTATEIELWYADETGSAELVVSGKGVEGLVWGEHALYHLGGQGIGGTALVAPRPVYQESPMRVEGNAEGAYVWQFRLPDPPKSAPAPGVWNAISPRVPVKVVVHYEHIEPSSTRGEHHPDCVTIFPQKHRIDGVLWGEHVLRDLAQRGIDVEFMHESPYILADSPAETCVLVNDGVVCT